MPGFRVSEIDKDRLKSECFCCICELVLRDPIQTESGVFICRSCHCHGNSPVLTHCSDGQVLAEREVPRCNQLHREIFSLVVSCTSQGCPWQGKLCDLEKHISASCGFVMVRCVHSACGVRIRLCHLSHHLQNECVFGLVRRTICGKEVSRNMLKVVYLIIYKIVRGQYILIQKFREVTNLVLLNLPDSTTVLGRLFHSCTLRTAKEYLEALHLSSLIEREFD